MSALGLLFVIARVYCRLISIRRLVVEDYIAIFTTVRASTFQAVGYRHSSYSCAGVTLYQRGVPRRCCPLRCREAHCRPIPKRRQPCGFLHCGQLWVGNNVLHHPEVRRNHSSRQASQPGPVAQGGHVGHLDPVLHYVGHHRHSGLGSVYPSGSAVGRGQGDMLETAGHVHLDVGPRGLRGVDRPVPRHVSQHQDDDLVPVKLEEEAGPVVRVGVWLLVSDPGRPKLLLVKRKGEQDQEVA